MMVLTVSSLPNYAKAQDSPGLWSAIGEYVTRLASNLDYIEIGSDDLGIDDGMIAKVIFGVSRIIERNPESKSEDDRYLVKDKMRIGLRLGAGFVLAGSASYIKQYTIVYPVSKKIHGVLHDKFIVNLLLPLQVGLNKLPKKYVLMTETFLEGQARLKFGGTPLIPLGSNSTIGRVDLTRTFIDQKTDKKIMVFRDKAKYTQLAQDISFSFGLIGVPIYEGRYDKGSQDRKYLEVEIDTKEKRIKCNKALNALIVADDIRELYPLANIKSLTSKFTETYHYFTLAWLFTIERLDRTDRIVEHITDGERDEYVTRYQVENRKKLNWTLGIDGEIQTSKLWAMARGVGKNGYIEPEVRIALISNDSWLKKDELENTYTALIDKIAFKKNFMNLDKNFTKGEGISGEFYMQIDMNLYEEAFEKLLATKASTYWKLLSMVSGKPISYFKEASTRNYHATSQRRLRQNRVTLRDLYLAKSMKAFIRRIEIANKAKDPLDKMHWLILALRKVTYVGVNSFSSEIFQIIHKLVGTKNLFIRFELISLVDDLKQSKENNHRVAVKTIGTKRASNNKHHPFYFQNTGEIYYLF